MDKFTPGPWTYSAKLSASENHKGFHIRGPRFEIVNGVYPIDEDGKEGEANARLMAVAPELLHELRHLVALLHPMLEQGLSVPGLATVNGARAAISKATGKA